MGEAYALKQNPDRLAKEHDALVDAQKEKQLATDFWKYVRDEHEARMQLERLLQQIDQQKLQSDDVDDETRREALKQAEVAHQIWLLLQQQDRTEDDQRQQKRIEERKKAQSLWEARVNALREDMLEYERQ